MSNNQGNPANQRMQWLRQQKFVKDKNAEAEKRTGISSAQHKAKKRNKRSEKETRSGEKIVACKKNAV